MKRYKIIALVFWSLLFGSLAVACRTQGTASEETAAQREPTTTAEPTATATVPALPTAAPTLSAPPVIETATLPPTSIPPTATIAVTPPSLGSVERPVQLLFPPVAGSAVIIQRVSPLVDALQEATDAEFAIGIADSEAALVELLCAAPEDSIGFISAAAYTIAHDMCAAQAGMVAVHDDGLAWEMGMLVIRPGSAAELGDLDGKRWAVSDTRSLPNYLYFRAQMAAAGVEPGDIVTTPEETTALLSLYDSEVDFTTASFTPPIMPLDRTWQVGESEPEEWRLLGIAPSRSPIGYVIVAGEPEFGGYRIRDARARMFDTTPDIFDVTRVLALSEPIPNETIVFGGDFPPELSQQILTILAEFSASDACSTSLCSADLFGWTGLEPADDAAYDPIRTIKDTLELEDADLWAELD